MPTLARRHGGAIIPDDQLDHDVRRQHHFPEFFGYDSQQKHATGTLVPRFAIPGLISADLPSLSFMPSQ